MVDPQPVDESVVDPSHDLAMRLVEHPRLLDPDRGERTDGEEAAVVEFGVGPPPVDQFIVLLGEHGLDRSGEVRVGTKREAMLVVSNFTVDDADLVDVVAEHGDAHAVVRNVPVDVERFRVARATAVLEHVPPPSVDRGRGDTHVVRHDVGQDAHAQRVRACRQHHQTLRTAARLVDRGVIDDVVAMVRPWLGRQQRRDVDPVGSEIVEVGDRVRGAVEVERRGDLQPVGGDGPGGGVHGWGVFMGGGCSWVGGVQEGVQGGVQEWLRSSNVRLPRHRWSRTSVARRHVVRVHRQAWAGGGWVHLGLALGR